MERNDSLYIAAAIKHKPSNDDPKEIAIVEKLKQEIFRRKWAKDVFTEIKNLQIGYFKKMLAYSGESEYIHDETQKIIRGISYLLRAKIAEGGEYLKTLPRQSPVIICTNHFGAYKLTGFHPKNELGVNIEGYNWICPLFCHASLFPVSSALGDNLYFIVADFPSQFGVINTRAGFSHVPPKEAQTGRTAMLREQITDMVKSRPASAIVNFPEGGTSGKYSGLGPYDLDLFKTGGYVTAAFLKIPIIPVAQYFDADEGFILRVFEPFIPSLSDVREHSENNRSEMQSWLDFHRS